MSRVWAAYNAALEKNPLLVKALTSLTGFTAGDVLAQKFVTPDEEKGYDLARTLRLGLCLDRSGRSMEDWCIPKGFTY